MGGNRRRSYRLIMGMVSGVAILAGAGGLALRGNDVPATPSSLDDPMARAAERIRLQGYNHVYVVDRPAASRTTAAPAARGQGMVVHLDENGNFLDTPPETLVRPALRAGSEPEPEPYALPGGGVGVQVPRDRLPLMTATTLPDGTVQVQCLEPGQSGYAEAVHQLKEGGQTR